MKLHGTCYLILSLLCMEKFTSGSETNNLEGSVKRSPLLLTPEAEDDRESKFIRFLFFPFVTFKFSETACNTTSGQNGTCLTRDECIERGGTSDGRCSKLTVCCSFLQRCGSVIRQNNTYLVNDEYPEATTSVGNCQYLIEKMNNNICQLRLDFDALNIAPPDKGSSLCAKDTFTVVGTAGGNPPVVCGQNSGHHMYVDLSSGLGSARVNVATTESGIDRTWKIKVTQIACTSPYRAPPNCLQHYTEVSGTITSFNYQNTDGVHQIGDQRYTICVKTKEGFCGISYKEEDFSLTGNATDTGVAEGGDDECNQDFLSIFVQDKTGIVSTDRYCGTAFNETTTYSKPFDIRVVTDSTEPTDDVDNRGFSLKYMQIPC